MNPHFRTSNLAQRITAVFLSLLLCLPTWAAPAISENQMISFEGTLTDTSGNPISLQGQQLFYYITAFDASGEKCVLFAESSSVSGDSDGMINHKFGSGAGLTSPSPFNHILYSSVFSGIGSGLKADGSGVSCSVAITATRSAEVYSSVLNVSASITLGSAPYAYVANDALKLNGKSDTDFVLATSLSGGTTGQVLSRNGASSFSWIDLPAAGGVSSIDLGSASATGTLASARLPDVVTSGTYTKVTVDSKGRVISSSALTAADIPNHDANKITAGILPTARGGTGMSSIGGANQLFGVNNSGSSLEYKLLIGINGVDVTAGPGNISLGLDPVTSAGTFTKISFDTYGRVTSGSNLTYNDIDNALGYAPANLAGDNFTGNTTFAGNVGVGTTLLTARLNVSGTLRLGNGGETCTPSFAGGFRYNAGAMEFCNGSAWSALANSGAGVPPTGSATGDLSGTYPSPVIASGAVTSAKILDNTIVNADIANSTIAYAKLNLADNDIPQVKISGLSSSLSAKENTVSTGTTAQYYRGDKSWQTLNTTVVPEGTNLYYTDTRVRAASLAGFVSGSDTTIVAADSILQAFAKVQGQLNARWQTSSSDMYFNSGNVTVGSNTFPYPGTKLFVKNPGGTSSPVAIFESWDTGIVSSTPALMTISRRLPAGVYPQNGFGSSLVFMAEDSVKALQGQAMIASHWVDASNGTSNSGFFIGTKDASGSMSAKMYIDQSGTYVTNKLVVSGSVQFSSEGSNTNHSCSAAESGKMRYNSTYKTMEYCDGANYQGVQGVTYCDAGYTLVGAPGTNTALCIDTNQSVSAVYAAASAACRGRSVTKSTQVNVCTVQQLDAACEANASLNSFNGSTIWTSNGVSGQANNYKVNYKWTTGSCHINYNSGSDAGRELTIEYIANSNNYRCCYQ